MSNFFSIILKRYESTANRTFCDLSQVFVTTLGKVFVLYNEE